MLIFLSFLMTGPLLLSFQAEAMLLSKPVGQVGDHIVTSREVQLNYLIEYAIATTKEGSFQRYDRWLLDNDRHFRTELSGVLIEWVVGLEAKALSHAKIDAKAFDVRLKRVQKIKKSKFWKRILASDKEIEEILRRKVAAKNFIGFRKNTIEVDVTDSEVRQYYENNPQKFANLSFEKYKKLIKADLKRNNVNGRLQDWFGILAKKYKVRSFLLLKQ